MIKILFVALILGAIIIYLKSINSELTILATIGAGVVITFLLIDHLLMVFDFFDYIIELSGLDREIFRVIFKITAIAYLVEFGADTLSDFGLKSVADKLVFAGKLIILTTSLPVIYSIFNLLIGILK